MPDKISVHDGVSKIRGIGSKKKQILSSMGIFTVEDLLSFFPVRYKDRRNLIPAARAGEDRESLVCGKLIRMQIRPLSGHRTIVECILKDESAVFSAAFFNMPFLLQRMISSPRSRRSSIIMRSITLLLTAMAPLSFLRITDI